MLQTAIVAKRTDDSDPDTEELRGLAEAAGAAVVGEVTQRRPEDPGTRFGAGKVEELAALVAETGADTVVVDDPLSPQQSVTLESAVGARVVDRHRVVLEIFADRAHSNRAQLQVELARLRYRLPRLREQSDEGLMNRFTESGTRLYDVLDRIAELERKLDALPAVEERHRRRRTADDVDLMAIAGYTNAGKSTLLRRLADDESATEEGHEDVERTVGVADRLFETLETTTRRATVDGRRVLLTDTVGFLDDLPHWLVESFRGTLDEVVAADAVLLVADVAQPVAELRRKLETARGTLGDDHPPVVTVLNKADLVDEGTLAERVGAVADLAPDPVVASATGDEDLAPVTDRLLDALPDLERERLELPQSDAAMSLVSWLHDEASEVDVEYGPEAATVAFAARPPTVAKARARAEGVRTADR